MPARLHYELLQTNSNHSARAQDLFMQILAEWRIDVAVVAEPYSVPPQQNWVGDTEGLVAVVVPAAGTQRISLKEKGAGYVAVKWGEVVVIGVYFSPNRPLREFEQFLGGLEPVVQRASPAQVVLMGDLNAKCAAWGCPITDQRGGGSIVDVTFATPAIGARIGDWRVLEEVETLSDHAYIRFRVSKAPLGPQTRTAGERGGDFPKWAISRLDLELAEEAAMVRAWSADPLNTLGGR
ncbi:uncharacterized protein [Choristoneura fumiferana]|uniref:uncharacterized protein n=1 Tax=Choristoneura fumiferana TaxID=7141 RepID=UPI003D15F021